ncbi:ABC transporter permease [Metaclostridioides mangenotii]|uniref:ABC transporter permease n=1 Tax=Metaclostridioides mangenotii TaxID=1540 RepID=UPI000486D949|nr:ABC transporter permease [Clostridioides mangenotii]
MKLYNISIKNLKNSVSNYTMYFASIVFCVFIFFSFKSIQYNEALNSAGVKVSAAVNVGSIIIAGFVFLFIYYSNSFFINRRTQEVGTYSLLGMRKNKIGQIFLLETIIMGFVATVIGVVFGFLFSKLITMMLMKLMNQMVVVKMSFSFRALIQTVLIFLTIFIVIGVRNFLVIRNKKLIDLFKKAPEKVSSGKSTTIKGILGTVLILIAYYMATGKFIENHIDSVFLILIPVIPGTFLFFSSAVSLIINIINKNKKYYYKGRNLVAFSELRYKIQKNSRILATIAILIAVSATVFGLTTSFYYNISSILKEDYKYSFVMNVSNDSVNTQVDKILKKYDDKNKVIFDKKVKLLSYNNKYNSVRKGTGKPISSGSDTDIIRESDFKDLMDYQKESFTGIGSADEAIIISNSMVAKNYEKANGNDLELIPFENKSDKVYKFKILDEIQNTKINTNATYSLTVVKDSVFNKLLKDGEEREIRLVDVNNKTNSKELSTDLRKLMDSSYTSEYPFNFSSYVENYNGMYNSIGLVLFIGMFLAVVFMLCTGSIIFLKQLSDIYDDKDRYIMLKKIGASNKDIEKILSKQLRLVFLLPLFVGTIHNIFAMTITQRLLSNSIVVPITITLLVYYVGYFLYYIATLKYAKKLIIE